MKSNQKYVIWRAGPWIKFRIGNTVHEIEWTMQRERELQTLMSRWAEELPDVE